MVQVLGDELLKTNHQQVGTETAEAAGPESSMHPKKAPVKADFPATDGCFLPARVAGNVLSTPHHRAQLRC